ncbi:MAG: APC family permease [Candidatus Acidiferrales bacterium]
MPGLTDDPQNQNVNRPKRVMGLRDVVFFYVVTGLSLQWVATAATAGASAMVMWIVAWLIFFVPLVLAVIELSSRYPQEGGLYVWTKQAFGEFGGFMAGWIYWSSDLPYLPSILYFAAANALFLGGERTHFLSNNSTYFIVFSMCGLALGLILNLIGVDIAKWLYNVGSLGTWVPAVILMVVGAMAWRKFGSATPFTLQTIRPATGLKDLIFWATIVYALSGAESASFMGDEIRDPRRTIPRGLLTAGVVITICYMLGTFAVLVALPKEQVTGLEGIMQAIVQSTSRIGWSGLIPLAAFLLVLSSLGSVAAWLAAMSRIPFVVGIDRFLPPAFARLHPRWGTPYVPLLIQAVLAAVFVFLGQAGTSVRGAYDVLLSMTIIVYFVPYVMVFCALIKLQREPAGPEVIRVPGGKPVAILVGIIGTITSILTIIFSSFPPAEEAHKGLALLKEVVLVGLLLALGAGIFIFGKRAARRASA